MSKDRRERLVLDALKLVPTSFVQCVAWYEYENCPWAPAARAELARREREDLPKEFEEELKRLEDQASRPQPARDEGCPDCGCIGGNGTYGDRGGTLSYDEGKPCRTCTRKED